jgi:hypothetical protein
MMSCRCALPTTLLPPCDVLSYYTTVIGLLASLCLTIIAAYWWYTTANRHQQDDDDDDDDEGRSVTPYLRSKVDINFPALTIFALTLRKTTLASKPRSQ